MERKSKFVKESLVVKNELLMPNDTNPFDNLMGGRLMYWMDIAAGISALKHSNSMAVTASVDNISFRHPIEMGCVITLEAKVTRAFKSSMEVYIKVTAENISKKTKFISNSAFFTFVAVDNSGKPVPVPEAIPETDNEKELYEGALRRRQLRLIFAGRLKPEDATELKAIFDQKI
ncbi:MAG: acyl-CoA thioesterase [Cyclobacteriaceae bacterium]|nr:acyl-CoA thioesterase [Cyclobacteriaceae bacterium]